MKNLTEVEIKHLIEIHKEAIATLELQISPRPIEPQGLSGFPPVVSFMRPIPGMTSEDPTVVTPFVAIRYANGCWFINRGGGATSQALSWDALLDWIGAEYWHTLCPMRPDQPSQIAKDPDYVPKCCRSDPEKKRHFHNGEGMAEFPRP